MRTIKVFVAVTLMALIATGCAQFEDVITKKEGRWRVTKATVAEYENDALVEETDFEAPEIITFNADGTASYETAGVVDSEVTVTWSYDESTEVMSITEDYSSPSFTFTITYSYEVLESKKKSQKWLSSGQDGTTRIDINMELERAD